MTPTFFLGLCLLLGASAAVIDERIIEPGANGTSVVLLTVAHLQQTTVFADDNGMLRRIAYAETRDWTREGDNIWQVSEDALLQTQVSDHPTLTVKHSLIFRELEIDWVSVEWPQLEKPLYSAIAARLVLFLAPERLPDASDIEGQALFWKRYYSPNGSVEEFSGAAHELEGKCSLVLRVGLDYNVRCKYFTCIADIEYINARHTQLCVTLHLVSYGTGSTSNIWLAIIAIARGRSQKVGAEPGVVIAHYE